MIAGLYQQMTNTNQIQATASIDMDTAMQIQQILREEMKESTVITIAHRLEAVKGADACIVLGKGKVVKQGSAADIMRDEASMGVREREEADEE